MNRKQPQNIYHANVNVNLMEENLIQLNGRITINADVDVKYYILNPPICSCKKGKY